MLVGMHDHDCALFEGRSMLVQDADERLRRVVGQEAVRAEQYDARSRAVGKGDQPGEIEIVGEHHVPVPTRPREYLRVRGPGVADSTPVSGLDAGSLQRFDPPRRDVHVDEQLQGEPMTASCSSMRHAA